MRRSSSSPTTACPIAPSVALLHMGDRVPVHEGRLLVVVEDEEPGAVTVEMIEQSRASRRLFGKNPAGAGNAAKDLDFDAQTDARALNVIIWLRRRQWGLGDCDRRFRDQNPFVIGRREHEIRIVVVEELGWIL